MSDVIGVYASSYTATAAADLVDNEQLLGGLIRADAINTHEVESTPDWTYGEPNSVRQQVSAILAKGSDMGISIAYSIGNEQTAIHTKGAVPAWIIDKTDMVLNTDYVSFDNTTVLNISSIETGNPTPINTVQDNLFPDLGAVTVTIADVTGNTPDANGAHLATRTDDNTMAIQTLNTTVAGSGGTVTYTRAVEMPVPWSTNFQAHYRTLISAWADEFADNPNVKLVYVPQPSVNGIEGLMSTAHEAELLAQFGADWPTLWRQGVIDLMNIVREYFPTQKLAIELHDVDDTYIHSKWVMENLPDSDCGIANWWTSGKTTYQTDLLNTMIAWDGDIYCQIITNTNGATNRAKLQDSDIYTAFMQARNMGAKYIEPWEYEFKDANQYDGPVFTRTQNEIMQWFNDVSGAVPIITASTLL
jgi:hypothetical protein